MADPRWRPCHSEPSSHCPGPLPPGTDWLNWPPEWQKPGPTHRDSYFCAAFRILLLKGGADEASPPWTRWVPPLWPEDATLGVCRRRQLPLANPERSYPPRRAGGSDCVTSGPTCRAGAAPACPGTPAATERAPVRRAARPPLSSSPGAERSGSPAPPAGPRTTLPTGRFPAWGRAGRLPSCHCRARKARPAPPLLTR